MDGEAVNHILAQPSQIASKVIEEVMERGSSTDGSNETWREEDILFHLSKAQAHLATHIKQIFDPRRADGENHLELALTRLAMALSY